MSKTHLRVGVDAQSVWVENLSAHGETFVRLRKKNHRVTIPVEALTMDSGEQVPLEIVAGWTPLALTSPFDNLDPERGLTKLMALARKEGCDGLFYVLEGGEPRNPEDETIDFGDGPILGVDSTITTHARVRPILETARNYAAHFERSKLSHVDPPSTHVINLPSPAYQQAVEKIRRYARSSSTVLMTGESGVGKEHLARALHDLSRRKKGPFVEVHIGERPPGLLEDELFGHVPGAFDGAHARRDGLFKLADGGTLFLDEVSKLSIETQGKLLRVIQERKFRPLGTDESNRVDVRIVAATNQDLGAMVEAGTFLHDLHQRMDVLRLHIPPLRDRKEDIPALVDHYAVTLEDGFERPHLWDELPEEARKVLLEHPWPGNVRQLENSIRRILVDSEPGEIRGVQALNTFIDPPKERTSQTPNAIKELVDAFFDDPKRNIHKRCRQLTDDFWREALKRAIADVLAEIPEAKDWTKALPMNREITRRLGLQSVKKGQAVAKRRQELGI